MTLSLLLSVVILRAAPAQVLRATAAPGIELTQELVSPPAGPLVINMLRIDLKRPGIRVRSELAGDTVLEEGPARGRESVRDLAVRHGAVAAVNADFFPYTGDPLGVAIRNGELLSEGMPHRVAMGLTEDGRVYFDTLACIGTVYTPEGGARGIDGINRLLSAGEVVLLTAAFGPKTRVAAAGQMVRLRDVELPVRAGKELSGVVVESTAGRPDDAIAPTEVILAGSGKGADWLRQNARPGERLRFRFDFASNPLPSGEPPRTSLASRAATLRSRIVGSVWTDVAQAVGGGSWLVRDGKPFLDFIEQGFSAAGFGNARHPRTAAGVTGAGELLLVTVDGRQPHSRGMTLQELAECLIQRGAVNAINLDGGGSTSMVVRGLYVNGLSDGLPRPVANALLVFAEDGSGNGAAPESAPASELVLRAGETRAIPPPAAGSGIWGSEDGKTFINQAGVVSARAAGALTAAFWSEGVLRRVALTVEPGEPAVITGAFAAVPNDPPDRNMLTLVVRDRFGNPVPGQTVLLRGIGGTPEQNQATTDSSGRVEVEVVWDQPTSRSIVARCGGAPPLTLKLPSPAQSSPLAPRTR